ncbi:MAG: hypothetical protein CR975_01410 [Gammaproteobacteria bacterium]|nr:MAG: hypothetical protein CR975_01410 [Gammaproteobacteria bacterium]
MKSPAIDDFDLLNVSLEGSHLLEAGAGTGKTYSLSFLYLRLLLEKNFKVAEIVVATFTNAATTELKARIYSCLCAADDYLLRLDGRQKQGEQSTDKTLLAYLTGLQQTMELQVLHKRLRLAMAQFDQAQIYSINAFALHLLTEHSITFGQTVPEVILDDDYQLIKTIYLQLADDNFTELGAMGDAVGQAVAALSSDDLCRLLTTMQAHYDKLKRAEKLFPDYDLAKTTFKAIADNLLHNAEAQTIAVSQLQAAVEKKYLHAGSYNAKTVQQYAAQLTDRTAYHPDNRDFLKFFSRRRLEAKRLAAAKQANITFDDTLFDEFNQLAEWAEIAQKADIFDFYHCLMQLLAAIRERLAAEKAAQMALTHDDVVNVVADKLDEETVNQFNLPFKAMLLDEAQDTNKKQLQIFQRLFLQRGYTCFFVGDPKQAIYGFRGGDVYTYLAMRQQVDYQHLLAKNYRSSQAVNDCINTLFAPNPFAARPIGKATAASVETGISYHTITGDKDNNETDFAEKSLSLVPSQGKNDLAETAANHLVVLLQAGHWINDRQGQRPLQCGDIAVLVRSGKQAEKMQAALAERGIAASYTGQNSVYSSDEAVLMHALLSTIAEAKAGQIKALMLSPLFSYHRDEVLNDNFVNELRQHCQAYGIVYQQRGFAAMFYGFMHHYRVGGTLLQLPGGKRRLSNWMQLFELLQTALQNQALTLLGLAEWLLRKISDHDKESELRLEDENAISIITMHKAKGLEFKVVCLPFFHSDSPPRSNPWDLLVSHKEGLAALKSLGIQAISDYCQAEQKAEDMRLAYVALTRAAYQNIIIEQPAPEKGRKNAARSNSLWQRLIGALDKPINTYVFTHIAAKSIDVEPIRVSEPATAFTVLSLSQPLLPKWTMTSFSALQQQIRRHDDDIMESIQSIEGKEKNSLTSALMQFPAGPKAGVVLHGLYEYYMAHRRLDDEFIAYADDILRQSQLPVSTSTEALAAAIVETTKVKLAPETFCLNDIAVQQQSIEMEFFVHLSPAARQHLYRYFGQAAEPLINGYLQGFIDYCFAHQGKFYVLDYKSNQLGEHLHDYQQTAMQQAMDAHRYDLQALIYTLALCRHLGINNPADYNRLIGGYYYLFIRGMAGVRRDDIVPDADNTCTEIAADNGVYYHRIEWNLLAPLLTPSLVRFEP